MIGEIADAIGLLVPRKLRRFRNKSKWFAKAAVQLTIRPPGVRIHEMKGAP
jgi:hypothetical protein